MKNATASKIFHTWSIFAFAFALSLFGCFDNRRSNVVVTQPPTPTASYPSVTSVLPANGEISVATSVHPSITFSEPVDPNTVTASSVKLLKNGLPVMCVTAVKDLTVTLMPVQTLEYSVLYTGVVTTTVKNLSGNALQQEYRWSFTTVAPPPPPQTYPVITSMTPAPNATNVSIYTQVSATFSELIDSTTVNTSSFKVYLGSVEVLGAVSLDATGKTIVFVPHSQLAYETAYNALITTSVKNLAGNALQQEYRSSFTTTPFIDVTSPTIVSVTPSPNTIDVPITSQVSVTFSESILASTANTTMFSVLSGNVAIVGVVSLDTTGKVMTFTPSTAFSYATTYTMVVSTAVKDLAGNALQQEYRSSFTTVAPPPPPQTYLAVVSTFPANGATGISITAQISVTFDEVLNTGTVNANAFKLFVGATEVSGTVSLDTTGKVMIFTPSASLAYGTTYNMLITTAVRSISGDMLQQENRGSFTTATTTPPATTRFTLDSQYHIVRVATDDAGNVYAYGYFNSPIPDVFVAKFTSTGIIAWKTFIATPDIDWPQGGIAISNGFVYIQRYRQVTGGSGTTTVFVDALSANGSVLWSTQVDTGSMPSALALDSDGNVYATNTHNTVKLSSGGTILARSTSGGSTNCFAFGGFFFASIAYVDSVNLTDRYLTRTDTAFTAEWTEWRRDTFNQDVIALAADETNSLLFVAEDSYTATSSSVTFQPSVTAYKVASGGMSATVAWTKALTGGRVTSATAGFPNFYVMLDGVPPTLQKLDTNGNVVWVTSIPQGGLHIAAYTDKFVCVASESSVLIFDASTGVRIY